MPNRIIKDTIFESEKMAPLTDFEFRLWIHLICLVDDAGRGDARPALIKGRAFPLRDRVTVKDIDASLHALAAKGCISFYEIDGKSYFWFPSWNEHQRIRDSKPKYPAPDESAQIAQLAASCRESPRVAATRRDSPPESNPNTNPNTNPSVLRAARFTPPTLADVSAYVSERHSPVVPQEFVDFYTANGWMVGKTPMKDWKAACRNAEKWERWGEKRKNRHENKRLSDLDDLF